MNPGRSLMTSPDSFQVSRLCLCGRFSTAGFFAAAVFEVGAAAFGAAFAAAGFAAGFFAAVLGALLLSYILAPATAAVAAATTAPATAADLPGLSLITLPALVAVSPALSTALFAVADADFAADLALPVRLSARPRSVAFAFAKVPVGFFDIGICLSFSSVR